MTTPFDKTFARTVPARRPHSVRRTTSIEVSWPEGFDGPIAVLGQGRDLLTTGSGIEPRLLDLDRLDMTLDPAKTICEVSSEPNLPGIETLRGAHAQFGFRRAIAPLLDGAGAQERPLAVLLDDVVGSLVMSGWLVSRWQPAPETSEVDRTEQENVCSGYATGSSALFDRSQVEVTNPVEPIEPADDPLAFHQLGPDRERTARRVRRIDVWHEGEDVHMDAMFQDTGTVPGAFRAVVHEYRVLARATPDAEGLVLAEISAIPGSLPYSECQSPQFSVGRLVGTPLVQLRRKVLSELRGPIGCTHLNDAIRSLAEVGRLDRHLRQFA